MFEAMLKVFSEGFIITAQTGSRSSIYTAFVSFETALKISCAPHPASLRFSVRGFTQGSDLTTPPRFLPNYNSEVPP